MDEQGARLGFPPHSARAGRGARSTADSGRGLRGPGTTKRKRGGWDGLHWGLAFAYAAPALQAMAVTVQA